MTKAKAKAKVADKPISTGGKADDPRSVSWFKPGNNANPKGRPKGSRNVLGEDFISALQADFKEHGPSAVETVRKERPQDYLKVIASILPKEVNVNKTALQELSDDELAGILDAVRLQVLSGVHAGAGDGADPSKRH